MDAQISELVLNQEPGYKIRKQARATCMSTLLEDGLVRLLEILRFLKCMKL